MNVAYVHPKTKWLPLQHISDYNLLIFRRCNCKIHNSRTEIYFYLNAQRKKPKLELNKIIQNASFLVKIEFHSDSS